jgi:hypothetical protein
MQQQLLVCLEAPAVAPYHTMPAEANTQPPPFIVRHLKPDDYDRGYLDTLAELTTVGQISKAFFISIYPNDVSTNTYRAA